MQPSNFFRDNDLPELVKQPRGIVADAVKRFSPSHRRRAKTR